MTPQLVCPLFHTNKTELLFQGVDLSNIIKDLALGSGDNHVVTENVEKLKELCSGNKYDHDAVLKELSVLKVFL